MAQDKTPSPEKQLLELIEKPTDQHSLAAATIRYQGQGLFSSAALKGRIAFLKDRIEAFFKAGGFRQMDIRTLNLILAVSVVALFAGFVVNAAISIVNLKKELVLKTDAPKAQDTQAPHVNSFLKAASYYLEKARGRDIFSMGLKKLPLAAGMAPSERVIEATKHLRLVGISWSDDPDVMIEDTKNLRTLFLKRGKLIDNEIKVDAVFKDKVILSYGGEEIELR